MDRVTALQTNTTASDRDTGRTRHSQLSRKRAENRTGYLFMLPWLIGFFVFTAGPMLVSLYLSFTNYDLLSSPEWVGLNNYARMIGRDNRWRDALQVTFVYVGLAVPLRLIFALSIAMILNRAVRGVSVYRAIYYLPSLLGGSVAIAVLWRELFGLNGLVNQVLALFGIDGPSWIGHPDTALGTLVILGVWQFGSPMIIFLAGLKQIPTELYEAAQIDGANRVQQFRRVTLPLLTPIIFFNIVMQTISSFQSFTPAFIVSGGTGGPADATLFYSLYLYQQGFFNLRMGYASALAWILLLIVGALTAINFLASRFWVFYGDERK
ncbi:MAG: sugar ABC transporter permease [Anaerolineae bacterium]|nr:sugar ABC transporter permease [Anaerolineae bacterium]